MLKKWKISLSFGGLFALLGIIAGVSTVFALPPSPGFLDPNFGTGGTVITEVNVSPPCVFGEIGTDVAVQADGKILLSGATCRAGNADNTVGMVRYLPDGTLDNAFGIVGRVKGPLPTTNFSNGMALQPDGKIVLAGFNRTPIDNNFMVLRYNLDGSLDATFDTDGIVLNNFSAFDIAEDVLIQPDGKILAAGRRFTGNWDYMLSRYLANGAPDTTFGSGGTVVVSLSAGNDKGFGVALQPDGKIVVVGDADNSNESGVVRLNADGTLDGTFGSSGIVTVDAAPGQTEAGRNVGIQSDGKIVVAGGDVDYLVFRLDGSGNLDSSFGTGGVVTTDLGGGFDSARDLLILPNGKIAVAGREIPGIRVVLYDTGGNLDSGFGVGGISELANFGVNFSQANGIALQADGKLVVGGQQGPSNFAIARYGGIVTNNPPDADAGPDQLVEWTGDPVNLDGTDSSDPDAGDTLSFSWAFVSTPVGSTATLTNPNTATPSFTPDELGDYVVELAVDDGNGETATDTVKITVEDTTGPVGSAALVPMGEQDDDEGRFEAVFSCSDACDDDPTAVGLIETPSVVGLEVKLKTKKRVKVKFDLEDGKVTVEGPDPDSILAQLEDGGLLVESGQLVDVELEDDEDEYQYQFKKNGTLQVKAPSVSLKVTCTDASGNEGSATAQAVFGNDDDSSRDDKSSDDDKSSSDDD